MKRVVILGPGGSGKSTLAVRLGEITGLRVIELDKVFWRPGLGATPRDQWGRSNEGLSQRTSGSWLGTSDPMTLSKSGSVPRTPSISWTSRLSDAHGEQ